MLGQQIILSVIGISAGITVSAGLFALIVEIGILTDFADRTHTGNKILVYENATILGGIIGNIIAVFPITIPFAKILLPLFGVFAGIFVGVWSMALAETLNVFPIFVRRLKIVRYTTAFIISMAIGRGIGALVHLIYLE